jgi:murein DD-endopeptidase MepM/ murein hydrolase activator NlpD
MSETEQPESIVESQESSKRPLSPLVIALYFVVGLLLGTGITFVFLYPAAKNKLPVTGVFREDMNIQLSEVEDVIEPMVEAVELEAEAEPEPASAEIEILLEKGENLSTMLKRIGIDNAQAGKVAAAMSRHLNLRKLRPGQKFTLLRDNKGVASLAMENKEGNIFTATRDDNDGFSAEKSKIQLEKVTATYEGVISGSFFASAKKQGMSDREIAIFTDLYKDQIAFKRDLRDNDRFSAYFESMVSPSGSIVKDLKLVFASLSTKGSDNERYYYVSGKSGDYYDEKGRSVKRFLSVRPIGGRSRMSSKFGKRRHPIKFYETLHGGVDYAAKTGTPIYAAGNGKITYYSRRGTLGKYVKIKHNSTYSTAYAHMNAFVPKLRVGHQVKKGQLIGYVGNTGLSTGPHLHFEVHKKGTRVDPLKQYGIVERNLQGKELKQFLAMREKVNPKYAKTGEKIEEARIAPTTTARVN